MAVSEKTINKLVDHLTKNTYKANEYFLNTIGEMIKQIRELSPSDAHKLVQMLKYGGKYQDIVRELSNISGIPKRDIEKIFSNYAKIDQNFYEKFYKYRNIKFTPFDENLALRRQTMALANITNGTLKNFTRQRALGYSFRDVKGNVTFHGLKETYERVLDEAVLNISQGKEAFDSAMSRILKEIGGSGLRTLDYESGRSYRLDSAIEMHLRSALNNLHNENQKIIADEIDADGVEISVHMNPAPDHEEAQGRQFKTNEYDKNGKLVKEGEWEKLQKGEDATDYTGKTISLVKGKTYRPISEYNCYHYVFSIVLGVSKPQYSNEQLQKIRDDNNKGFEYDGVHYTNYQGTQLQRLIERKIREQQDIHMLAKASNNIDLANESQMKITELLNTYNKVNKASGLQPNTSKLYSYGYKR